MRTLEYCGVYDIIDTIVINHKAMEKKIKTAKQMERNFKGIANSHRIDILLLVSKNSGITNEQISQKLDCDFKTVSEHSCRLFHAGLVNKKYVGRSVAHTLSPYGKIVCNFIKTFQCL